MQSFTRRGSVSSIYNMRCINESGSFRSFSRSVRSFRPDFRGESFRSCWGGSFRPFFISGSFRPDFWGESFRSDVFTLEKTGRIIRLSSPWFCLDKAGKRCD